MLSRPFYILNHLYNNRSLSFFFQLFLKMCECWQDTTSWRSGRRDGYMIFPRAFAQGWMREAGLEFEPRSLIPLNTSVAIMLPPPSFWIVLINKYVHIKRKSLDKIKIFDSTVTSVVHVPTQTLLKYTLHLVWHQKCQGHGWPGECRPTWSVHLGCRDFSPRPTWSDMAQGRI